MIESAAAIADVPISDEYKEMMIENLNDQASGYEEIYKLHMPNSVAPALIFDPVTSSTKFETERRPMQMSAAKLPDEYLQFGKAELRPNYEILAFASVRQLAAYAVRITTACSGSPRSQSGCQAAKSLFNGWPLPLGR